jgi:hypothetical protein
MGEVNNANIAFWNDEVTELNPQRLKKEIPALPVVPQDLMVVRGQGLEVLAFLMLQIQKTPDKKVIIRAIASACSCLLDDATNFTGGKTNAVLLTGLDIAADDKTSRETVLRTNFADAEDVTVGELLDVMEADADEIGAYFGVLFLAGNKRINSKNRTAFNEKRKASATASIIGEPVIFVNDSIYLADKVLENVYAAFLSCSPMRAIMTSKIVRNIDRPYMGPALAFISMFMLLVDSGMSALKIIKEAVIKHPWIRTDFPELRPELYAANQGQLALRQAPATDRSFLKAIHGNAFVPVNYSDITNLLGVCKEVLKRTTPTYANYDGGKITPVQRAKIEAHPDIAAAARTDLASE